MSAASNEIRLRTFTICSFLVPFYLRFCQSQSKLGCLIFA